MLNKVLRSILGGLFLSGIILSFNLTSLLAQDAPGGEPLTHTVQAGENLYRIALRYGIDLEELVTVNQITDRTRIFQGQVLIIPGLTVPDESDEVFNPLIAGTPAIHVVQPGENLSGIAHQYGMTLDQLLAANNIANANLVYKWQELQVWTTETVDAGITEPPENAPAEVVEGAPPVANTTYIVQAGEHLAQIARRYGMNWTTLASINGISDPNHVYAGQELIIPALNADGGIIDMGIITPAIAAGAAPTITVGKQIVVDLSAQRIYAYQDGVLMRSTLVSSGLPATPTVLGDYAVRSRIRSQTMTGPGYSLPNVEWVQYFYQGYAIHGTYWHNNFGSPMSHGCVNLTNAEAEWFWGFATIGTPVHVQT
jgi:LysM repeat protein